MERDERFLEVINELQITAYTLEKENGIKNAQAKVSHYKKGVTKSISSDIIVGLCEAYPQVNANYILTGNGPMFKEEQEAGYKQEVVSDHSKKLFEEFNKQTRILLAQRDEEIRDLQLENAFLKAQNNMQNVG